MGFPLLPLRHMRGQHWERGWYSLWCWTKSSYNPQKHQEDLEWSRRYPSEVTSNRLSFWGWRCLWTFAKGLSLRHACPGMLGRVHASWEKIKIHMKILRERKSKKKSQSEKNQSLIEMTQERKQSLITITLGRGVISFELLGLHETECGSEAQPSF